MIRLPGRAWSWLCVVSATRYASPKPVRRRWTASATAAVDVVVLDVMLPGVDGFEVCRRLRRDSDVPVIMLTARGDDFDIVAGLEAGADDYVVKPVEPRVLDARIRAVLRRMARAGSPAETYGELVIDRSLADRAAGGP